MLLGELGLVLVASLPAGCLLGHLLARGLASSFETEMFRLPLVIEDATYGMATSVTLLAAAVSALIVWRRINALDLTLHSSHANEPRAIASRTVVKPATSRTDACATERTTHAPYPVVHRHRRGGRGHRLQPAPGAGAGRSRPRHGQRTQRYGR